MLVAFLSKTLDSIKLSPTIAMTAQTNAMRARGCDVITLSAGEPDFDTPNLIKQAAQAAIDAGKTKYTAPDGMIELKRAIIAKFKRDNKLHYSEEQISVSNGGKQVLYNALMATVNPGDEVIISAPYWVSYPDMVLLAGGIPIIVKTSLKDNFKLTPKTLAAAISARTKWVIFNSPSNPSGYQYSYDELKALCAVLLKHPHVWVMSDDIYEHISYRKGKFCTPAAVEPRLYQRVLTVNGVSKAYAMTGWRIGYGAGAKSLIAAMRVVQSQSTSNPCTISQWAARAALKSPVNILHKKQQIFKARRDLLVDGLNQAKGVVCAKPDGAFYVYPSIKKCMGQVTASGRYINSDQDFCKSLLDDSGVGVVSGVAFGLSPHFRVSYATSEDILVQACQRIQNFCAGLHNP